MLLAYQLVIVVWHQGGPHVQNHCISLREFPETPPYWEQRETRPMKHGNSLNCFVLCQYCHFQITNQNQKSKPEFINFIQINDLDSVVYYTKNLKVFLNGNEATDINSTWTSDQWTQKIAAVQSGQGW
jgi:hypothetical protein